MRHGAAIETYAKTGRGAGFTLIEILAVITIIFIIAAIFIVPLRTLLWKKSLETAAENMANTIRLAQSHALASRGEAPMGQVAYPADWGIHFDLVNPPLQDDRYWLFRGASYPGDENQAFFLPDDVRISRLELGTEPYIQIGDVLFPHLSGEPQINGSVILAHRSSGEEETLTVLPSGEVRMGAAGAAGDPNARIMDTRHIHALLIQPLGLDAAVTFDFPDPSADETVTVGDAVGGDVFDYTSTVNGERIRVHTHTPISDPNPLISVNRDRRENALPVTISINFNDGLGPQELVTYDAAGAATAGPAVETAGGEPQLFIQ